MVTALLIDDEQHCISRLEKLLEEQQIMPIQILKSCTNIESAYEALLSLHPQLVFLDVQLKDKTCFELLSKLKQIDFDIIFTTASEQYAVQAFKFSAVDYLLKPIAREDLMAALSRLNDKLQTKFSSIQIAHLLQNFSNPNKRICIADHKTMEFVPVQDIIRCEADVNYTHIFLENHIKKTASKPLKEFEVLLTDYGFFRVHQSHLINLQYIKKYDKGKGGIVYLTDGSEIEVSTRKKEEFLKIMASL